MNDMNDIKEQHSLLLDLFMDVFSLQRNIKIFDCFSIGIGMKIYEDMWMQLWVINEGECIKMTERHKEGLDFVDKKVTTFVIKDLNYMKTLSKMFDAVPRRLK